jgi:hypothetical protein
MAAPRTAIGSSSRSRSTSASSSSALSRIVASRCLVLILNAPRLGPPGVAQDLNEGVGEPRALRTGAKLRRAQAELSARSRVYVARELLVEAAAPPAHPPPVGKARARSASAGGRRTELRDGEDSVGHVRLLLTQGYAIKRALGTPPRLWVSAPIRKAADTHTGGGRTQPASGAARAATSTGRSAPRMTARDTLRPRRRRRDPSTTRRAPRRRANSTTRRAGVPASCYALADTPARLAMASASSRTLRPALSSASSRRW